MKSFHTELSECKIGGRTWVADYEAESAYEAIAMATRKALHPRRPTGFYGDSGIPARTFGDSVIHYGVAVRSGRNGDKVLSERLRCAVRENA